MDLDWFPISLTMKRFLGFVACQILDFIRRNCANYPNEYALKLLWLKRCLCEYDSIIYGLRIDRLINLNWKRFSANAYVFIFRAQWETTGSFLFILCVCLSSFARLRAIPLIWKFILFDPLNYVNNTSAHPSRFLELL